MCGGSVRKVCAGECAGECGICLLFTCISSQLTSLTSHIICRSCCSPQRIIERQLTDEEIDSLALVAVAGMAAEGREYEEVSCWGVRSGVSRGVSRGGELLGVSRGGGGWLPGRGRGGGRPRGNGTRWRGFEVRAQTRGEAIRT